MRYTQILPDRRAAVKFMEGMPRVLFLGMQGSFSSPSLQALVESGVEVCAVVVPAAMGNPAYMRYALTDQLSIAASNRASRAPRYLCSIQPSPPVLCSLPGSNPSRSGK